MTTPGGVVRRPVAEANVEDGTISLLLGLAVVM